MKKNEKKLRSKEAAEIIGIAPGTLANLRCRNRGPRYYRQGRRIVYFISDIKMWMKIKPAENN